MNLIYTGAFLKNVLDRHIGVIVLRLFHRSVIATIFQPG
jgi:hypothetical protein